MTQYTEFIREQERMMLSEHELGRIHELTSVRWRQIARIEGMIESQLEAPRLEAAVAFLRQLENELAELGIVVPPYEVVQ